jgi:penicillin-binding protein 2
VRGQSIVRRGFIIPGIDQRAGIVNVLLIVAFLFLIIIFVRFQLVQSDELRLKSDENRLRVFPLMPPRGVITDRKGRILAGNRPFYSVSLLPGPKDLLEKELMIIARVFPDAGLDISTVLGRLRQSSIHPIRVLERVSTEALAVLEEHREMLPGLKIQSEPLRYYPHATLCSHVLGYVGSVSQQEVDGAERGEYRIGDYIGRSGIESEYDDLLRGRWGASYIEVDAVGREVGPYEGMNIQKPLSGESLTLTIDLDLQVVLNDLFPVEARGAVVCLDPRNGEVLALFSNPSFDPNDLSRGLSNREWNAISNDPTSPLLNRTIQSAYPPGSTFKSVTAIAAFEKGVFLEAKPECVCYGGMNFGRRWFGCWKEGGHGHMDFFQGLAQSCDVYFYKLGIRVGLEDLTRSAVWLGLGSTTGIDLPGEVAGLIPTLEWYDRTYGPSNWGRGVIMNLSIGQGEILTTPIQLARLYGSIANGGTLVIPHLIKGEGNNVTDDSRLEFADPDAMALLKGSLAEVVNGERGTARLASSRRDDIVVSGKTGTAQNPHGEDHALFIGYAPLDEPEIVCVAVVEESGHGGSVAAPIVGGLLRQYFSDREPVVKEATKNGEAKKSGQRGG